MKKWIAVLVLMAWAALAFAQTIVQQGQTTNGANATSLVGGRITGTNTGQDLQFNSAGKLLTSNDGGLYRLESTDFVASDLAAKSVTKTNTPNYAQDISKVTALLSWATSDTDSVACEVFVVGKVSGSAADGYDYLIDMNPSTRRLDGVRVGKNQRYFFMNGLGADSTNVADFVWASNGALGMVVSPAVAGSGADAAEFVPGVTLNQVLSTSVSFAIAPKNSPGLPQFVYYSFWIANYANSTLDDVNLRLIVRGN